MLDPKARIDNVEPIPKQASEMGSITVWPRGLDLNRLCRPIDPTEHEVQSTRAKRFGGKIAA
ncbi:MAG: hypothetical protein K0R41_4541 [Geminicoccaceae bacterium]|nr:hypothetical protein [Geminicoccaceae bacterium]